MKNVMQKMKILLVIMIATFSFVATQAQETVTVTGVVFCEDSIMGTLPDVNVFNKNSSAGTISSEDGKFSIRMGRKDTLIFSTIQHTDQFFFFGKDEAFEDRTVTIPMKMDSVLLNMVTVMGQGNFEAFKQEMLALKLPDYKPEITVPIVNKYAAEYGQGKGSFKIHGPLIYLSDKIRQIKRRENRRKK